VSGRRSARASRGRGREAAFAVALAVQLVLLYWPRAVSTEDGLPWDKLVHALVFGLVMWTGVRAGIPARPWLVVSLAHAVLSEVLQSTLLPDRAGDPWDSVADVVGVLLAAALVARNARNVTRSTSRGLRNPADGVTRARE
jgi:hypothetical protein